MTSTMSSAILEGLNSEPFHMNWTPLSLESISNQKLLQTLSDVLVWIQGTENIDIRSESPEETTIRILNALKILKYPPPKDLEQMQAWRLDLLEGQKQAVYPIMEWIFNDIDRLKERVYLANYLTRIEVPVEEQSIDVQQLLNRVQGKMEEFRTLHSKIVDIRSDFAHVEDIRSDLKAMYDEKEQLLKSIERNKQRIAHRSNLPHELLLANRFRQVSERYNDLVFQQDEQRNALINAEQRAQRLRRVLNEAQKDREFMDPTKMIQKFKQEIDINRYLVNEKLKNDKEHLNRGVELVKKILSTANVNQDDIRNMTKNIDDLNQEIKELMLERDKNEQDEEDKLSIYRHQSSGVLRKKGIVADELNSLRQELSYLDDSVMQKKKEVMQKTGNNEFITSVQFKKYVNKMRTKSNIYKKKKLELDTLTSEMNILNRTVALLNKSWEDLKDQLVSAGRGVIEDEDVTLETSERPKTAKPQNTNLLELKSMVKEISDQLLNKRNEIDQLVRQVEDISEERRKENESILQKKNMIKDFKEKIDLQKTELNLEMKTLNKTITEIDLKKDKTSRDIGMSTWFETIVGTPNAEKVVLDKLDKEKHNALVEVEKISTSLKNFGRLCNPADQIAMWKSLIQLYTLKMCLVKKKTGPDIPIGD